MAEKTDNHNPKVKLDLRRHFLRKYHADGDASVLDCCQGSAVLWTTLRSEFSLAGYWGVDLKPKKGRLKIDSVRILQQAGWRQNVVDVDTYGSPWKHWLALLPNVTRPTTVFLTIGLGFSNQSRLDRAVYEAIGLSAIVDRVPAMLKSHFVFRGFYIKSMLSVGCVSATILEAVEAVSTGNARYIGVHLVPSQKSEPASAVTPTGSPHQQKGC